MSIEKLATTTMKLALVSKEADKLAKERRTWENKTENNFLELESLENALKTAKNMGEQPVIPRPSTRGSIHISSRKPRSRIFHSC